MILKRLELYNSIGIMCGLALDFIEIDFTKFDKGLILLQGKSGSGKTTILNNLHPYRVVGEKDDFKNHFYKDGYRKLELEYKGNDYICEIYESVALLFRNGKLLNSTKKVSDYDKAVIQEFGNKDAFFKLLYAGRKYSNILSITKGERKDLIINYLLEYLQKYGVYLDILEQEQSEKLSEINKLNTKLEEKNDVYQKAVLLKSDITKLISNIESLKYSIRIEKETAEKYKEIIEYNNSIKKQIEEYEDKQDDINTSNLKNEKSELEHQSKILLDKISKFNEQKEIKKPENTLSELKNNKAKIQEEYDEEKKELQEKEFTIKRLVNECNELEKEIANFSNKKVPCSEELQIKCPLTEFKIYNELESLRDEQSYIEENIAKLEEEIDEFQFSKNFSKILEHMEEEIDDYYNYEKYVIQKQQNKENESDYNYIKEKLNEITKKIEQDDKDYDLYEVEIKELIKKLKADDGYVDDNRDLIRYEKELSSNETELSLKTGLRNDLKMKYESLQDAEDTVAELTDESNQYELLKEFFSPTGGKIFDIEQAGEEIGLIANALLDNYVNKQIRIKFDTLKENSKGELKEVFDVMCSIDGGEWKTYLSDGEAVIVSNAIREAMSYLKQQKDFQTTFIDELDGSIDAESRINFMKLLEHGAELNNRHHTILISHSTEVDGYIQQGIKLDKFKLTIYG